MAESVIRNGRRGKWMQGFRIMTPWNDPARDLPQVNNPPKWEPSLEDALKMLRYLVKCLAQVEHSKEGREDYIETHKLSIESSVKYQPPIIKVRGRYAKTRH